MNGNGGDPASPLIFQLLVNCADVVSNLRLPSNVARPGILTEKKLVKTSDMWRGNFGYNICAEVGVTGYLSGRKSYDRQKGVLW
jgi:hypothetical protein